MTTRVPLVVDLDGSYLRTDTLHELLVIALRRPTVFLRAFRAYFTNGKARAKEILASEIPLDVSLLPVNATVDEFVRNESKKGRVIVLATGADRRIAEQFVRPVGPFDAQFSSDGVTNLTGAQKAQLLAKQYGAGGFDYIGNARADRGVWKYAQRSHLATNSREVPRAHREEKFDGILRGTGRAPTKAWLKAIRPHQSLKNVLLFLPLIAAHQIGNLSAWLTLAAGFIVFSLMASSVYLLNDALDLSSDRVHASKHRRPIAAGDISPLHALAVALLFAIISLILGALLGLGFFAVLCAYALTTITYSFWLKRVTLVDVIVLALLYMMRIFAGATLVGISLSFWFISVTTFLFLSLAFAKRFAEVVERNNPRERIPGRGYQNSDSLVLAVLGAGAGVAVVIFFASYIQSDEVQLLYVAPQILWLVIPIVFYWIANVWVLAGRGEMHEDPMVFALNNRASQISGGLILIVFLVAAILPMTTQVTG